MVIRAGTRAGHQQRLYVLRARRAPRCADTVMRGWSPESKSSKKCWLLGLLTWRMWGALVWGVGDREVKCEPHVLALEHTGE